jgi:hypothetical protein
VSGALAGTWELSGDDRFDAKQTFEIRRPSTHDASLTGAGSTIGRGQTPWGLIVECRN